MTKYKVVAQELEAELNIRLEEIEALKTQLASFESNFAESIGDSMESDDAKEILRLFARKAENRQEVILLVRALSRLPA